MSGFGDAVSSWWSDVWAGLREMWIPLAVGAALVLGTYALWHYAQTGEQAVRDALVGSEAGRVEEELGRALDRRVASLDRFVAAHPLWPSALAVPDTVLERADFPFRAVLLLDAELRVVRAYPAGARATSAANPGEDEARRVALQVITEIPGHAATMVGTIPLAMGGRQLLVCEPVFEGTRPRGFVVGVLRVQDLLDEVLAHTLKRGFSVGVYEGPEFIYGTQLVDGGPGTDNAHETAVARDAVVWRVQLWPAEELFRSFDAHAPIALFWLGIGFAFVVSLTIYLWRERPPGAA